MGLGTGFINLFKNWGKGIGNAADKFWLGADAQKAIREEIEKKFQSKIDLARTAESKRADNIKDLDDKLTQSKKGLADAQKAWKDKYDTALAGAKAQRQTDIDTYNAQLKTYQDALANAKAGRQSILDQLQANEARYNKFKTIFTDVNTGKSYVFDPSIGKHVELTAYYNKLKPKQQQTFNSEAPNYDNRLIDFNTGRVINAFDESNKKIYKGSSIFDNYYPTKISAQDAAALRDAEDQVTQASRDLSAWKKKSSPNAWGKKDLTQFEKDFEKNNGVSPTEYSFNGKNYGSESELDKAYKDALNREKYLQSLDSGRSSRYASKRDAEIAQRIQDAKDMNKAKAALVGTGGAGALYAGAKAIYGRDNTDNTDNGKPDPDFNIENTPEVKAQLNDEQSDTAPINTGFDPDKADAIASAAYDQGVEDANSIEPSTGDLGNNIGASTGGHTIDDKLFELIKAMEDPYKADAVANYIYSRHGNDPELQNLGWRAWLNKYYGDSLRSMMNIDPSGYKGMHVSGGL